MKKDETSGTSLPATQTKCNNYCNQQCSQNCSRHGAVTAYLIYSSTLQKSDLLVVNIRDQNTINKICPIVRRFSQKSILTKGWIFNGTHETLSSVLFFCRIRTVAMIFWVCKFCAGRLTIPHIILKGRCEKEVGGLGASSEQPQQDRRMKPLKRLHFNTQLQLKLPQNQSNTSLNTSQIQDQIYTNFSAYHS